MEQKAAQPGVRKGGEMFSLTGEFSMQTKEKKTMCFVHLQNENINDAESMYVRGSNLIALLINAQDADAGNQENEKNEATNALAL